MTDDMNDIARKTKIETASMKVITVVTLCFLPGTFISVCELLILCNRFILMEYQNSPMGQYVRLVLVRDKSIFEKPLNLMANTSPTKNRHS